jgi:Lipoprotein LpqB beta-propeller domain
VSRAALAACAVALSAAVASCATLPSSGSIPIRTLQNAGIQGQTGLQVEPVPPGRAWSPEEIVQGFLAASASFGNGHRIARDYLSRGFAKSWRPGAGATVVDRPGIHQNNPYHNVIPGGAQHSTVSVKGKRFATLLTAGQDQAGSVVVAPASTIFRFSLVQQDGAWRIDGIDESVGDKPSVPAPKSLLLLTRPDFERDYLARDIYFFTAGQASRTLIPDPVYFPQNGLVTEVRGLINALIQPPCRARSKRAAGTCPTTPPDSSWLFGAAVTAFPRGVRPVRQVQVIGGVKVIVDLGNTAAKTTRAQRRRMAAQLAWSLTGSYGSQASQIRSVVLQFGHQSVTASLRPASVPRGLGWPLYYQVPASPVQQAQVVRRNPSQPFSMTVPRQAGGQPFALMAASPSTAGPIVLAGCTGRTVYLLPQARTPAALTRRLPAPCTSLSWDNRGNLWIAASTGAFVLQGAGGSAPESAKLVPVVIPLARPKGKQATMLRVAPDGVRVAMLEPSGATSKIMIAAISRKSTFTYIAQTAQMLRVGSDLANPTALSWLDPDHLLVLDRSGGHPEIYEVPLNGGRSTEISTPPGVTSLSAAWPKPGEPPRVVIGIAPHGETPATIEQSSSSLINPDWRYAGTGITPVLPG